MLKRLDGVDLVAGLMIGLTAIGILIGIYFPMESPALKEIHPKPGITCFVYQGSGLSCLKD